MSEQTYQGLKLTLKYWIMKASRNKSKRANISLSTLEELLKEVESFRSYHMGYEC